MKTKMILALGAGVVALGMSGCAAETAAPAEPVTVTSTSTATTSATNSPETVTSTATVSATVTEAPSASETAEDEDDTDYGDVTSDDLNDLAISMAWNDMTSTEQQSICDGWNMGLEETLLDVFMDAVGDSDDLDISRSEVKTFFDGKCSS